MSLEDIRARESAATPGPWYRQYGDVITSNEDPRQSEQDADGNGPSLRIFRKAPHLDHRDRQGINNATFAAHARTDIPKLIAALDAVDEELSTYMLPSKLDDPTGEIVAAMEALELRIRVAISKALGDLP